MSLDDTAQAIVDGFAKHAAPGAYIEKLGGGYVRFDCVVLMQDVAAHVLGVEPPGPDQETAP